MLCESGGLQLAARNAKRNVSTDAVKHATSAATNAALNAILLQTAKRAMGCRHQILQV